MDIKIETVLTITLVTCVLYYLMCRCDCREGLGDITPYPAGWDKIDDFVFIHDHLVDNETMFDLRVLNLDPSHHKKINYFYGSVGPFVINPTWMVDTNSGTDYVTNEGMLTLLNILRMKLGLTRIGVEYDPFKLAPWIEPLKINVDMAPGHYKFWDWSGDSYNLFIREGGKTHTIRYDSDSPRLAALWIPH